MTKCKAVEKINKLSSDVFNLDEKKIAKKIIMNAPEKEVDQWYRFVIQRVKFGFRFESAPDVAKGRIAYVSENKELNINCENKISEDENKLIIGENYDALKNLLLTYSRKIDIIYIDPPYNCETTAKEGNSLNLNDVNIGNKYFIYRNKFGRTGWLNLMQERMIMARDLLKETGIIFISIDDVECAYLKILLDEIFGEINFISDIIWKHKAGGGQKFILQETEHILCYGKNVLNNKEIISFMKDKQLNRKKYKHEDANGYYFERALFKKRDANKNQIYSVYNPVSAKKMILKAHQKWHYSYESFNDEVLKGNIVFKENNTCYKKEYYKIEQKISNFYDGSNVSIASNEQKDIFNKKVFDFSKPIDLVKYLCKSVSVKNKENKEFKILDFFAGSGTTGHAVMQLNKEDGGERQFILITNNENNIGTDVCYERLHRIIKGKGTKNESFKWIEKNDYYEKNKLRVFNINYKNVEKSENVNNLENIVSNELKKLNSDYNKKNIDLYYDLNALNPLQKEE